MNLSHCHAKFLVLSPYIHHNGMKIGRNAPNRRWHTHMHRSQRTHGWRKVVIYNPSGVCCNSSFNRRHKHTDRNEVIRSTQHAYIHNHSHTHNLRQSVGHILLLCMLACNRPQEWVYTSQAVRVCVWIALLCFFFFFSFRSVSGSMRNFQFFLFFNDALESSTGDFCYDRRYNLSLLLFIFLVVL